MATGDKAMVAEAEARIPRVFSDFRQAAADHGVHDQVVDMCELNIARAFFAGTEQGPKA